MKIVVCIKQVPAKDAPLVIAEGTWIRETDIGFEMNEPDSFALEEALRLKEKHSGVVLEKRSWFSGPGGAGDGHQPTVEELEHERALLDMLFDETGKLLPNKSMDKIPEFRKQMEDQLVKRRKAIDDQLKALKPPHPDGDRKSDDPPKPADKKPGEPL